MSRIYSTKIRVWWTQNVSNTDISREAAGLLSTRLMRTRAMMHSLKTMAAAVEAKPDLEVGDRDLETLIEMSAAVHDEFESVMREVNQRA